MKLQLRQEGLCEHLEVNPSHAPSHVSDDRARDGQNIPLLTLVLAMLVLAMDWMLYLDLET